LSLTLFICLWVHAAKRGVSFLGNDDSRSQDNWRSL
jgi:hypothetical protein